MTDVRFGEDTFDPLDVVEFERAFDAFSKTRPLKYVIPRPRDEAH
jgi:hypothetical protein